MTLVGYVYCSCRDVFYNVFLYVAQLLHLRPAHLSCMQEAYEPHGAESQIVEAFSSECLEEKKIEDVHVNVTEEHEVLERIGSKDVSFAGKQEAEVMDEIRSDHVEDTLEDTKAVYTVNTYPKVAIDSLDSVVQEPIPADTTNLASIPRDRPTLMTGKDGKQLNGVEVKAEHVLLTPQVSIENGILSDESAADNSFMMSEESESESTIDGRDTASEGEDEMNPEDMRKTFTFMVDPGITFMM